MIQELKQIKIDGENKIATASNLQELENARVTILGKSGAFTMAMKGMKDIKQEERATVGVIVNDVRNFLEKAISDKLAVFEEAELNKKLENEKVDISEPSKDNELGALHPLTNTTKKLVEECVKMGFTVVSGPEIELDYYNFEALNLPKDHPARDMQDSFYINDKILMRTQTSNVQVRAMETLKPPFKIISPGRTYRVDNDATHSPVFHQFEGLVVDENISLIDLKTTLTKLLSKLFGEGTKIRFRPSYFPFTEPSVEVDCTCLLCKGKGCTRCKGTGWMELLGAGIVNKKVLENCGIDSDKYIGFAFGPGLDRLSMVEHKITDLRLMFENDVRFLSQFK